MERVTGIGGVFFRSGDPERLAAWYEQHLGVNSGLQGDMPWQQEAGATVWAPFPQDSDYFGRPEQQVMVNFRVRDLTRCSPSYTTQVSTPRTKLSRRPMSGASLTSGTPLEPDLSCGSPPTNGESPPSIPSGHLPGHGWAIGRAGADRTSSAWLRGGG